MKLLKRLFLVILTMIVLIVGGIIVLPYLFKDEIIAQTKEEINKTVNAEVSMEEIDLSLLSTFPNLTLEVNDYSVIGKDEFEGIPLVKGASVELVLDLASIVSNSAPISIKSIHLVQPEVNVQVLKSGKANYDIAVPTDERIQETAGETDYSNFVVALEEYSISDAKVTYEDKSIDTYLYMEGVNHNGSGQFTTEIFDLFTNTQIESLTAKQGGINYLNKAKADLNATFNIDQPNSKYSLKENELKLNQLQLNADGFVQLIEEDIYLDLELNTPQNDFKRLLSMIPNAYIEGYEDVKADGSFSMNGLVRGAYNGENETYPAFRINLDIENANIKYPDLPLGIDNIVAKVGINSPSSNFNDMVINIPQLRMKVGNNPFTAQFRLETPISDPDIDTKIDGVINLEELSKAFPIEGLEELNGIVTADVEAKTRMSYIDKEEYEKVNMNGDIQIEDMMYRSSDLPPVNIKSMDMSFTPQNVGLKEFDAKIGKSDVQASGTIDNILAYFSPEKTMTGDIDVQSNYFYADEWLEEESSSSPAAKEEVSSAVTEYEVFDRFDFKIDGQVNKLDYDVYTLENLTAKGQLSPSRMKIEEFESKLGKSDMRASGEITNVFPYVFDGETLGGNIKFRSNLMDLNQFMTSTESTGTTSSEDTELEPFIVPDNLALTIDSKIGKVLYDNMELRDVRGDLIVENEAVVLDDVEAKALGGEIMMSGGYDSKDKENPGFSIKYDLQKLDFQDAFEKLNTFQALAPIGEYINGNFTTSLIMDGKLGKDLMPQLSSLNAQGFLQTLNAVVANFKPLQAVGNTLNVQEFTENIKIKGTKNWFEVKDGRVEIKEFDYKLKDIDMKISGFHGLTQDMSYKIKAKIPRELMEANALGAAAGTGLDALTAQANKLGLNLKESEFVNVMINLTGSMKDPKVKFNLLGTDGEASLADAAKDQVKEELNEQKDQIVKEATEKANEVKEEVVDSVKTVVDQEVDKAKDKAKEALEKEGEKLGTSVTKEAEEILGEKGKEEADKIKNALDDFNPFKKKKKDKKKDGN